MQSISGTQIINKSIFLTVFLTLSISIIAGKILERIWISKVTDILVWIGSFWLAAFIYFLIFILFIDFLRLINHIVPYFPSFITSNFEKTKFITSMIIVGIVIILIVSGYINAINPRIKTLELNINKKVDGIKSLNIVAVSDIHLGTIVGNRRTVRLINKINSLKPDIVLFAGDMIDDNIELVKHHKLLEHFSDIKSKFGVFAVPGNHEYIGGAFMQWDYYQKQNITVLKDTVLKIDNSFYIVGRDDIDIKRYKSIQRKTLPDLLIDVDKSLPIILLDHQPYNFDEAANNGIDLQISGHTHNGQLWPINYITKSIFEISWGYKKKKETHFYVSSGFGTSGPPIRLGNRPEILKFILRFN